MKHFDIYFKGYRRDINKETLPTYSGVYCVYRCIFNQESSTVSLRELIYIGQAENLNERLNNHNRYDDFVRQCQQNEELCYSYAQVPLEDLDEVENALIFMQQPQLNGRLLDDYNHEEATFEIEGKTALLVYTKFEIS